MTMNVLAELTKLSNGARARRGASQSDLHKDARPPATTAKCASTSVLNEDEVDGEGCSTLQKSSNEGSKQERNAHLDGEGTPQSASKVASNTPDATTGASTTANVAKRLHDELYKFARELITSRQADGLIDKPIPTLRLTQPMSSSPVDSSGHRKASAALGKIASMLGAQPLRPNPLASMYAVTGNPTQNPVQQATNAATVGPGTSPSANPIGSFGPLAASPGTVNGNAGLGVQHNVLKVGGVTNPQSGLGSTKPQNGLGHAIIVDRGIRAGKPATGMEMQGGPAVYSGDRGEIGDAGIWSADEVNAHPGVANLLKSLGMTVVNGQLVPATAAQNNVMKVGSSPANMSLIALSRLVLVPTNVKQARIEVSNLHVRPGGRDSTMVGSRMGGSAGQVIGSLIGGGYGAYHGGRYGWNEDPNTPADKRRGLPRRALAALGFGAGGMLGGAAVGGAAGGVTGALTGGTAGALIDAGHQVEQNAKRAGSERIRKPTGTWPEMDRAVAEMLDPIFKKRAAGMVDKVLNHPATPFVVQPVVGMGMGLGMNEIMRRLAEIQVGKPSGEDEIRRGRLISAGAGAGWGLSRAAAPHIPSLFPSQKQAALGPPVPQTFKPKPQGPQIKRKPPQVPGKPPVGQATTPAVAKFAFDAAQSLTPPARPQLPAPATAAPPAIKPPAIQPPSLQLRGSPSPGMGVADKPIDVAAPGMMGPSGVARPLEQQFAADMGRQQRVGGGASPANVNPPMRQASPAFRVPQQPAPPRGVAGLR